MNTPPGNIAFQYPLSGGIGDLDNNGTGNFNRHVCFRSANNRLMCLGEGEEGQLGRNDNADDHSANFSTLVVEPELP